MSPQKKRKLDVLMLSRAYPPTAGGVATHVSYLAEALSTLTKSRTNRTRVCRVEMVTATEPGSRVKSEAAHPVGRKGARPFLVVHRLPGEKSHFTSFGDVPFETPVRYLFDNWRKIQPDVIHAHDFEAFQIGLMLKTAFDKPLILTLHRTPKDLDVSLRQRDPKDCFLHLVRGYSLADAVVAPSNAYKEHLLREGFPANRVRLIYHGVPVGKLLAMRNRGGVVERLDLSPEDTLVLCPIRLDPHKSPETFIDATAIVRDNLKRDGLVFAIAGSGSNQYRMELQDRAKGKGIEKIVQIGAVDGEDFLPEEMPTLYRRASICVLPSRREGFGQVLLEAAVFKCPVLGANTGGIPEVITTWKTGLLFNRDEPQDLATQLSTLLQDKALRELLAKGAFEEVQRRFDAERMAREYVRLYLDVAGLVLK